MNDFLNDNNNSFEDKDLNTNSSEPQPTETGEEASYNAPSEPETAANEPAESFSAEPDAENVNTNETTDYTENLNFKAGFSATENPINFSPVAPINDYRPMNKGLKVFVLIMALVIALTSACTVGYFWGKNSVSTSGSNSVPKVDLAARPDNADEMTAAIVYEKINSSIVGILTYNDAGNGGNASGIVYSEDGYIVTNDHIYAEIASPKFKIYTADGKEYNAKYVAGDKISDLAVLKITDDVKLETAVFGNSDEVFSGQNVVAVGRPNGAENESTITTGIISSVNERVQNATNYSARLIQTDCAINPGNSGGALIDMYGQVIGVTCSKLAGTVYDNVGYAIPTTVMKRIVDELISEGKVVSRAKLGITYSAVNSALAEVSGYKHTGLLIASVAEDSGLYGKAEEGDFITHINGTAVTRDDVVLDIIEKCSAGDTITVTIISSSGDEKTVDAVLKANIGESSYTTEAVTESDKSNSGGGTFDFPFGE